MADSNSSLVKDVRKVEDATVVTLSGDVDLHQSPALHAALVQVAGDRPKRLVLDLSAVPYIDSSGIGTFVEVFLRVKSYKGKMIFFGLSDRVRCVFEITKLDKFFTICQNEADAVRA